MSKAVDQSSGIVGNDQIFQARLATKDGTGAVVTDEGKAIKQADVSAISYSVFDMDSTTPATAVASGSLTVSAVIFDVLTDDNTWTADSVGKNFQHVVSGSGFATAGHTYRIVYSITLVGNAQVQKWYYEHTTVPTTPS